MAFKILTEKSDPRSLEILLWVNYQPHKNPNLQNPSFLHNNNPTAILSLIWQLQDSEPPPPPLLLQDCHPGLLLGPLPGLNNSPSLLSSSNNNPGSSLSNNNLDNLSNSSPDNLSSSLDVLVPNNPPEHNSHKGKHLCSIKVKPPNLNCLDQDNLR